MSLRLARESIAGQRPMNEDSVLIADLGDDRMLLAVADGMGGHAAGEVASKMALEVLQEEVANGTHIVEACRLANQRVYATANSDVGKKGMGTTLVAMLLEGGEYHLVNVGDSRAYEVTGDGIRQITEDHSFVAEAIKRGQPEEEAKLSRWKDALTRSIGTDAEVEVDIFGPFSADRDAAVLLCSDGLFKTLTDVELRTLYTTSPGPEEAAGKLVTAAFDGGSDDNISVVIAEFGEVPRRTLEEAREEAAATLIMDPLPRSDPAPEAAQPPEPEPAPAAESHAGYEVADTSGFPTMAVVAVAVVLIGALLYFLL